MKQKANWSSSALAELAETCDVLLREDLDDLGRMAIPLLHFRSAHPNSLMAYQPLLTSQTIRLSARNRMAGWCDQLGSQYQPAASLDLPECADILFVSHYVSSQQAAHPERDLYFGDLPQSMASNGYVCAIALINHTDRSQTLRTSAQTPGVLLKQRLSIKLENEIANQLERTARHLGKGPGSPRLRQLAANQARTGAARQGLRIAFQVADLVRRLRPRALVLTYEGHAWERLVMQAARSAFQGVKCYAVHHAILAPLQYAMRRRYGAAYDPDHIFTAGQVAHQWLRACADLADLPIDVLGSARAIVPQNIGPRGGDGNVCLFLPEGLQDESLKLSRAAHTLAVARPDLSCVVRLHPLMSKERLAALAPELEQAPKNFQWSPVGRALSEDTASARWAVYRGSSAILAAIADGVEPVYLGDEPADLRIDPLHTRTGFGLVIPSNEALISALNIAVYDEDAQSAAQAYANQYYTPLDAKVLTRAMAI